MSELRWIDTNKLRVKLAEQVSMAYEGSVISVVTWYDEPGAVLMPVELWRLGRQRRPVDEMMVERIGTRAGRDKLRVLLDELRRGRHTVLTVWNDDRAVLAPYAWARGAFPEWDLPEAIQRPPVADRQSGGDCVQVVYRKSSSARELLAEFAAAEDPQWEVDRRLSSGPGRIPLDRRSRLRAVVTVEDGVVARVRALDPDGVWEDVSERVSLAPVSAPLTREEIDQRLPTLGLRPGDPHPAPQGAPRQYVDL